MFEVQSKWVAAVLSGRVILPSVDEMMDDLKLSYETQEALGIPKRYTHKLGKSQVRHCLISNKMIFKGSTST